MIFLKQNLVYFINKKKKEKKCVLFSTAFKYIHYKKVFLDEHKKRFSDMKKKYKKTT